MTFARQQRPHFQAPVACGRGRRAGKIAAQEQILTKPRPPISTTNLSLRAWQARTRQQTRDDREAEAKYDIDLNCDLCGMRIQAGSRMKSSVLTEPPVTGTLALQDVRRRSQSNEEDR